ncbi:MAG: DUF3109 family protein [Bacteroidales bacterium]|nr:DUF3109 family protein [Bacteroidales bacterium]
MIEIGGILVSSEVVTEYFCCDYPVCKGACCVIGDSGAPLQESEAGMLEREYGNYKRYMSAEGRSKVEETGFFEIDADGDMVTPLLRGSEECAYTRFEGDNVLCAIERAWCEGRCRFAKPISCRLYPIRVSTFRDGTRALNLHRWDICRCAFEKGRREGIRVYEFLRGPLVDAFGVDFYEALSACAGNF